MAEYWYPLKSRNNYVSMSNPEMIGELVEDDLPCFGGMMANMKG